MGVMALSVTALWFFGIRYMSERSEEFGPFVSIGEGSSGGSTTDRLLTVLGGFQEFSELRSTSDPDEAVALAVSIGRLEDTRADLDVAVQRRGLIGWFTSRIDSLGFGLGWWTLYFAILMPWMKGQTPGKRALGVRVVRLDGQPVTWWHAFERAGGYAAGVATGTLGFLQIYWDANRQAIHDKVAGTVVIRVGVPKVPGNWDRQVIGSTTRPSVAGPT